MDFLGLEHDEDLLEDIFNYIDKNSDDKISCKEFIQAVNQCN